MEKSHRVQIGKVKLLKKSRNVTVNDLLTKDDVNGILQDLDNIKPDIKNLLIIWTDKDDKYYWEMSDDILVSQANLLLDLTKDDLIRDLKDSDE